MPQLSDELRGATYEHGCIWCDHVYPPDRGYGYVAASRFKSKAGIYLFGKVRRTDWRPVRETAVAMEQDHNDRSEESDDDYDSDPEENAVRSRIYRDSKWLKKDSELWPQGRPDDSCDEADSDASSEADYEKRRDAAFASRDEAELWEEYNFEFPSSGTGRGLPDLSDL